MMETKIDLEFIKDSARKYADACEFKSDFPHDWKSVRSGFIEGFTVAQRLLIEDQKNKEYEVSFNGINIRTVKMIHYDLALKANEVMKKHSNMKVEEFRELPEVKKLWAAMDILKENYL